METIVRKKAENCGKYLICRKNVIRISVFVEQTNYYRTNNKKERNNIIIQLIIKDYCRIFLLYLINHVILRQELNINLY